MVIIADNVVVNGGYGEKNECYDDFWELNLQSNQWNPIRVENA